MMIAMFRSLLLTVLCGLVFPCAHAQLVTQDQIASRFVGKTVLLRGLYGADKLRFDAAGRAEQSYQATSPSMSGFQVKKVQLSGQHLRLEGKRMWLVWDGHGRSASQPANAGNFKSIRKEKLSVEIDGGSGDFAPALDAVFADSLGDMVADVPDEWKVFAGTVGRPAVEEKSGKVKAVNLGRPAAAPGVYRVAGNVRPPRVIREVDARFNETARRMRFSGNVIVSLVVDENGDPQSVRIARPLGLGLDEEAVAAVQQWRFAPATKDGKPVPVEMAVEVNFQIF